MRSTQLLLLSAALGVAGGAWAQAGTNVATNGKAARDANGVLLQERDVYVPVGKNGQVVGNDMIVVEKQEFMPAGQAKAWARAGDASDTFVIVPDPKDSKGAPAPRYYLYRLPAGQTASR